jgi:hypothetical protein
MIQLSLTEEQTFAALRSFLLACLTPGIEVIQAQGNRVSEPIGSEFVLMTKSTRERISTNKDDYVDAVFTGSIAIASPTSTVLTITAVGFGTLAVGRTLLGTNIAANTVVLAQLTGTPGGIGTYSVSVPQTIASQKIAAGVMNSLQPVKFTAQLDIHGEFSADNAHIISTLFRDEYGIELFKASGYDVTPLYANEAHQLPFNNGEQQVETRWTMDVVMQCNPIVTVPQYFADQLNFGVLGISSGVISVDASYPP